MRHRGTLLCYGGGWRFGYAISCFETAEAEHPSNYWRLRSKSETPAMSVALQPINAPAADQKGARGLTRTQFLRAFVGGILLTTGTLREAQTRSDPTMPVRGMLTRPIPSTGEAMPVIGLGTWRVFDVGTDTEARRPLREVLQVLLEFGGRVIDTSPMYGRAEAVIGDLLLEMGARSRVFLATKVWTEGSEHGIAQMQHSAQLLRSEVIDLMQIHNLMDWRTQLSILRRMKARGDIRYIGITHYTTNALPELARILVTEPGIDFVQLGYSLATREPETELLPIAAAHGIAVIVNQPFEEGGLFRRVRGRPLPDWAREIDCRNWAQLFLKYILAEPSVTCVIPATNNPEHMKDNAGAGFGRLPDLRQRQQMRDLWDAI
jgi:diketogulonate reductase-like aldo/keto reductase